MKENYICLEIDAPDFMEEPISYLLWQEDCHGVVVDDPRVIAAYLHSGSWEASVFDGKEVVTGRISMKSWFANDEKGQFAIKKVREALVSLFAIWGIAEKDIIISESLPPDVDWLAEFKNNFHSRVIGEKIIIKPTWEDVSPQKGQIVVEMDPGMAFGSGDHTTTALCLVALQKYLKPQTRVVDIGCGSAILAIAAALLGAKKVLAVDYDAEAVKVAEQNIIHNNVQQVVNTDVGNLADDLSGQYEMIFANIVADPIIALIPKATELLTNDGVLICSGILDERSADVQAVLVQNGLQIVEDWHEKGWYAVVAGLGE